MTEYALDADAVYEYGVLRHVVSEPARKWPDTKGMEPLGLSIDVPSVLDEQGAPISDLAARRREFLASLASDGRLDYKRYLGAPIRYAGGKSLAVGYVVELIPDNVSRLVSPFIGGGSVEVACANELGMDVVGYDVFDILVNYWQVQLSQPVALADKVECWEPTDAVYRSVKERLRRHWKGESLLETPLELAAHYWFNHNLGYGPGFLGWMSRIYEEHGRVAKMIDKVRSFRSTNLRVKQGSFERTMLEHTHDFLYCDPPYYLNGDSKMFRGIYPQRNFPVHHNGFDHARLREILRNHKGGFILSYNDCSTVREMYSDCRIIEVDWQYTLGQGEMRIGKNRIERGTLHNVKKSHELLITNF